MKYLIITIFLVFLINPLIGQKTNLSAEIISADIIIDKVVQKVMSIKSINYQANIKSENSTNKTPKFHGECQMVKDSLHPLGMNIMITSKKDKMICTKDKIYLIQGFEGEKLIKEDIKIKDIFGRYYSSLFDYGLYTMMLGANPLKSDNVLSYQMKEEKFLGKYKCYQIEIRYKDGDVKNATNTIFIDTKTFFPVGYASSTEYNAQVFKKEFHILNFEIDRVNDRLFDAQSIESKYMIKDYIETKKLELLAEKSFSPAWSLSSLEGEQYSNVSLKGKCILLDFWYSSCGPCLKSMPYIEKVYQKYKDNPQVLILGVNTVDKEKKILKNLLTKKGINYNILINGLELAQKLNITSYPTIYIFDKEGKVYKTVVGEYDGLSEDLYKLIDGVLLQ